MNIIDHGEWEGYTPPELPEGAPKNALFARRKSDMTDWYQYIYPVVDPPPALKLDPITLHPVTSDRAAPPVVTPNFGANTIKCGAFWRSNYNAYIVGAVTQDVTLIFPAGQIVFEITDYIGTETEAFAEFNNKAYDPATGTFSEPVLINPPETPVTLLQAKVDELSARLAELETEMVALKRK